MYNLTELRELKGDKVKGLQEAEIAVIDRLSNVGGVLKKVVILKGGKYEEQDVVTPSYIRGLNSKGLIRLLSTWGSIGHILVDNGKWNSYTERVYSESLYNAIGYLLSKQSYDGLVYIDGSLEQTYGGVYKEIVKSRLYNLSEYDKIKLYTTLGQYYSKYIILSNSIESNKASINNKIKEDIEYYKGKKLKLGLINKAIKTYQYKGGDVEGIGEELAKVYIQDIKKNEYIYKGASTVDIREQLKKDVENIIGKSLEGIIKEPYAVIRSKNSKIKDKYKKEYLDTLDYGIEVNYIGIEYISSKLLKGEVTGKNKNPQLHQKANKIIKILNSKISEEDKKSTEETYNKLIDEIHKIRLEGLPSITNNIITGLQEYKDIQTVIISIGGTIILVNPNIIVTLPSNVVYYDRYEILSMITSKDIVSNEVDVDYGKWIREVLVKIVKREENLKYQVQSVDFKIEYPEDISRVQRLSKISKTYEEELKDSGLTVKMMNWGSSPCLRVSSKYTNWYINPNGIINSDGAVVFKRVYEDTTSKDYSIFFENLFRKLNTSAKNNINVEKQIGYSKGQLKLLMLLIIQAYDLRRSISKQGN